MNPESLRSFGIALPPGRMITSDEGDGDVQPLWLGDQPVSADLWRQIRAVHRDCGLWPLLLDARDHNDAEFPPWGSGELLPERMSSTDEHDPAAVLAQWWADHSAIPDHDHISRAERLAITAPFEQAWPGRAPACEAQADPDQMADEYAPVFAGAWSRLGLVAAARGADALAAVGWIGPGNYDNDIGKYAAVVRDWEDRFGACVVAVGGDTR